MTRMAWWEKIPVLLMILSILLAPVRAYGEDGVVAQFGGPEIDGFTTDAALPAEDTISFDPVTDTASGVFYVDYGDFKYALGPCTGTDTVSKIASDPDYDADADVLVAFKTPTDDGPMGVAIKGGVTAVVPCVTTGTVEVFDGSSSLDTVGSPVILAAGAAPWEVDVSPIADVCFITDRGTGSVITLPLVPLGPPVSTAIPPDATIAGAISDPLDIEITPGGAVGWMTDFDPALTAASAFFGFGSGKRIIRFSTAAPGTQLNVDIDTLAAGAVGPWGLDILPAGTTIFTMCNSGHVIVSPNDEAGAVVAVSETGLLFGEVAADLFVGIPLWDGDSSLDSGKLFLSAHSDLMAAPLAPGPDPGAGEGGALVRIFTVAGAAKFTDPAPGGPAVIGAVGDAEHHYDVATRPAVVFFDSTLSRRKSGGHACYVGGNGSTGLPFSPLALLGLGVAYFVLNGVRVWGRRDAAGDPPDLG